jgi:isopentenyl diphosphate isomerase/L-lactate dehydrogenase-like FMN-dependent dehydrogenase
VEPLNVHDYERLAAGRLDPGAYGYFAGGADDEVTLRDNVAAFARVRLRPRVLVDVANATTETTVLGQRVAFPVLVAPMAYLRAGARAGGGRRRDGAVRLDLRDVDAGGGSGDRRAALVPALRPA